MRNIRNIKILCFGKPYYTVLYSALPRQLPA